MESQHAWLKEHERRQPNLHNGLCLYVRRGEDANAALARERISTWFSDWDDADDPDIKSRLNSEIDEQFISAAWELYVNALLKRLGFSVTRLEQANSGSKPDFLVEADSFKVYVEASAIHPTKSASVKIWNELRDKLNSIQRSDVFFGIWPEKTSQTSPKFSSLRHQIKMFLDNIENPATLHKFGGPEEHIKVGGWSFRVQAFAHHNPGTETKAMLISGSGDAVMINDLEDLRTKLEGKGSWYKNLEHPLVLAVLENSFVAGSDHWHRMGALYGKEALLVSVDGTRETESIRLRDGLWDLENGDSKLSAIVLKDRLNLPWPEMGQPSTWFNPTPATDLRNSPLNKLSYFSVVGTRVEEVQAKFFWNGL